MCLKMLHTVSLWAVCCIQCPCGPYAAYIVSVGFMLHTVSLWAVCCIQCPCGLYAAYSVPVGCMLHTVSLWAVCCIQCMEGTIVHTSPVCEIVDIPYCMW